MSDSKVSGNAVTATGNANASSVKSGKNVSFVDSTQEAHKALLAKLAMIIGRVKENNKKNT